MEGFTPWRQNLPENTVRPATGLAKPSAVLRKFLFLMCPCQSSATRIAFGVTGFESFCGQDADKCPFCLTCGHGSRSVK